MSGQTRLASLISAIGADIKALQAGGGGSGNITVNNTEDWTYVTLTSTFLTNGTANLDSPLTFTPLPNKHYEFEVRLYMQSSIVTTGVRPGVKWPSVGISQNIAWFQSPISATAASHRFWGNTAAANAASTAVPVANEGLFGSGYGNFVTGGIVAGNFIITLASEVAATEVRFMANSYLRYREVGASSISTGAIEISNVNGLQSKLDIASAGPAQLLGSGFVTLPLGRVAAWQSHMGSGCVVSPLPVWRKSTLNQLGVWGSPTAGDAGTIRLAIYGSDPVTGFPTGAPLWQGAEINATTIGAGGFYNHTGIGLAMTPGVYWLVAASTGYTTTYAKFCRPGTETAGDPFMCNPDYASHYSPNMTFSGYDKTTGVLPTNPTITLSNDGSQIACATQFGVTP